MSASRLAVANNNFRYFVANRRELCQVYAGKYVGVLTDIAGTVRVMAGESAVEVRHKIIDAYGESSAAGAHIHGGRLSEDGKIAYASYT